MENPVDGVAVGGRGEADAHDSLQARQERGRLPPSVEARIQQNLIMLRFARSQRHRIEI